MSAGTYFGKYYLLKRLAQGGMGEIYIARQQGPGGFSKTVALKKILPHLTENKEFIQGFLGEAALSAKMTHRNIVQVFDFGLDEESGSYFLTMEYVAGKPLNSVLEQCVARKERLPLPLIKDIAIQMSEGMSYAHNLTDDMGVALNLVHRDLNPANLLVSYSGDVKIIDWGIAKSEMSQVKTEAGMIKGKFVYMSPEQSMAKKLDKRSDIFAGGITLYEMLTGENPFHKPNVVLSLEAIQRLDPPPPSEFDPALAPFDSIVAKALAKDRDKRYADFADMAEDLKQIVLPGTSERLGQLVGRLFRTALEEEQKLMQETGAARPAPRGASVPGARVTSSPGAAVSTPGARVSSPGARASSPGARVSSPGAPAPASDEAAGSTMVLSADPRAQEQLQREMDSARRRLQQQRQPPPPAADDDEPVQRTMFIGAADLQPQQPKKKNSGLIIGIGVGFAVGLAGVGAFLYLNSQTPEPAPDPVVDPRPANPQPAQPGPGAGQPANGGTQVAAPGQPGAQPGGETGSAQQGSGTTTTAGAGAEKDDAAKAAEKRAAEEKALAEKKAAEEKAAADRKAAEEKEAADKKAAEDKAAQAGGRTEEPQRGTTVVAAVKSPGTLLVRTNPKMPMTLQGRAMELGTLTLPAPRGALKLGDDESPVKITALYKVNGDTMSLTVSTEPWSLVTVNGQSRGKVPVEIQLPNNELAKIELKTPAMPAPVTMLAKFSE